ESFALRTLWARIEELDNRVSADVQLQMMVAVGRLVQRVTLWFLRHEPAPLEMSACNAAFRPAVEVLSAKLEEILPRAVLTDLRRRERNLVKEGVPQDLAWRVASLHDLAAAADVWRIAQASGRPVDEVGRIYVVAGDRFGLEWLRHKASRLTADGRWQKAAITAVVDDLFEHQSDLTRRVLEAYEGDGGTRKAIDAWASRRRGVLARTEEILREVRSAKSLDVAMLVVADDQLRRLVHAVGEAE
ncbi:MAG TPA: NAD-glutamate dehydrogenase, partial [Thermoanaerobaculia bacterium]